MDTLVVLLLGVAVVAVALLLAVLITAPPVLAWNLWQEKRRRRLYRKGGAR